MPPGQRQIEMTWRCSSCSHQNLGRDKTCQQCGDPKDTSEKYEMPADTARAATVTEAALLRMAEAGPNWRCAFCGSDQRRADASCGNCGASAKDAEPARPVAAAAAPAPAARPRSRRGLVIVAVLVAAAVAIYLWVNRTRTFTAKVAAATWSHTIAIDRYQIWTREGWRDSQPRDAFDVVSKGQQIHHYDDVLDGYDTQYYTEQVACGQDCTTVPETCRETCSDNGNGFATCQTTCSGGGQRCTTRYCSEPRSRQVARYRKEPRYAEGITYKIWDWGFHRKVSAEGTGTTGVRWPVEEARLGQGLGPREQERETRTGTYRVVLGYGDSDKLELDITLDELARYPLGSEHSLRLKRGEPTLVDGQAVKLVSDR